MSSDPLCFQYSLPVNLVFGSGRAEEAGRHVRPWGTRAMIVTGGSSAKRSGLYERVRKSLEKEGVESILFDEVQPNPLTTTAEKGAQIARQEGCEVIVGIGGGSIMDCAKAVAFLAVNEGSIHDYIFGRAYSDRALPLVLIPTTCGTGSEGNGFAVLTNPENGDKKSLRCPAILPRVSIVDPDCMKTMPPRVLSSVGFDALCHCMEAYTANRSNPLTDALSLHGMRLIAGHLPALLKEGGEQADWEAVTMASTIGGMVIGSVGVTLAHGMEHPASGLKNLVHGQGLAALTPVVTEHLIQGSKPERFADISRILGGKDARDCPERIRAFLASLSLTPSLGDLGITEEDIPWMAENCLRVSAGNLANTPLAVTKEEIAQIYREAL